MVFTTVDPTTAVFGLCKRKMEILVALAMHKSHEYSYIYVCTYRKIASPNTSHLEAHVDFFRLLMEGIFGPYVV